jgi:integrase
MARQKLSSSEITRRKRAGLYHDGRRPLTAKIVQRLKGPGRYHDGLMPGLYLQVSEAQTKSWLFRYQLNGSRERWMGLGAYPVFSLAEVRAQARVHRQQLHHGIDPLETRDAEKAAAKHAAGKKLTFREAATRYSAQHEGKWKNPIHRAQFLDSLTSHAFSTLGDMDVGAIETPDLLRTLQPIWNEKTETASRVRGRIESVLDWATVFGHRPRGDNPARWKGHLDQIFPNRRKLKPIMPHKAVPYAELPTFMVRLRAEKGTAARAAEFTILTAVRSGETFGALWTEFDLDSRLWTIPAGRMKAGREHRVPLSSEAVALLQSLPREKDNPHVFIGGRSGHGLPGVAMRRVLERLGIDATIHGFRSAFSTWAHERTSHAAHTIEISLAHTVGSEVARAYMRGDMFQKRIRLMQEWARYCYSGKAARTGADVVAIRQ